MNQELDREILKGNTRAAARLMRLIDDRHPGAPDILARLFSHTGDAYVIGITGNPGSGKSTLVNQLITEFRARGQTVGCIAVDPTSPFSGGAILGDRVRMQDHAGDDGVFIRSVATRGHLGGLSRSTPAMVQVMDAMGFDVVLIETVGVGQDEIEIVRLADTSLVVMVPGLGDDIQADKAGLMEIADVFVLNKADRPGIDRLKRQLRTMLSLHTQATPDDTSRRPSLIATNALDGEGVDDLVAAIDEHRIHLDNSSEPEQRFRRRCAHLVRAISRTELDRRFDECAATPAFEELIDRVASGDIDPYSAAEQLAASMLR